MKEISKEYQQIKVEEQNLFELCSVYNKAVELRSEFDRPEDYKAVNKALEDWDRQDKLVQKLRLEYQNSTSSGRLIRDNSVILYPSALKGD